MFRSRVWRQGRPVDEGFGLADLDVHLGRDDELVWFDVRLEPDSSVHDPALVQLAGELHLSGHQFEDVVAPGERSKVSRHGGHTFLTVYALGVDRQGAPDRALQDSRLAARRISALVLSNALVTLHQGDVPELDEAAQRWEEDPELLREAGVGALLHGLLDTVVDGHFAVLQELDDAVEALEDQLFGQRTGNGDVQRATYRLRKELVELRRVVLPMREVVSSVMRPGEQAVRHDGLLQGHLEDLHDHVLRAAEWTEGLRDMVNSLFETNLSLQDARRNTVMKKLAGWAAVIAVPTAVTGWFGQNVPYPGFSTAFGFWESVVAIVVGTVGLYLVLRSKDWI